MPSQRSKDSSGRVSPFIAEDAFLERANPSRFSNSAEQLIAQRYSSPDTNLFTPIYTRQSVTNNSHVNLSHPPIGFTPEASPNVNIFSSPLDTYPTNEDFDDQPQPIKQTFRNIYEIMEAIRPFEALMADFGPEPIDEIEDNEGDIPLEDINLTPKAALNGLRVKCGSQRCKRRWRYSCEMEHGLWCHDRTITM